jgi:mono/diheme cytochrome c family protein
MKCKVQVIGGIFVYLAFFVGCVTPQKSQTAANSTPKDSGNTIEVWTRKPGNYRLSAGPEQNKKTVDLTKLNKRTVELYDQQYASKHKYVGVSLSDILNKTDTNNTNDIALLHFDGGMMIPIRKQVFLNANSKLSIFVATEIYDDANKPSKDFPPYTRQDPFLRKFPPVQFSKNKVVASSKLSSGTIPSKHNLFSPWLYVRSLTGIELVNEKAYFEQFDVSDAPLVRAGAAVFKSRCQYCHGVQHIGASYGWDFVDPMPVYKKRMADSLFQHVKYPKAYAIENGIAMPNQKDVSKEEIDALWKWLEAIARAPVKDYRP